MYKCENPQPIFHAQVKYVYIMRINFVSIKWITISKKNVVHTGHSLFILKILKYMSLVPIKFAPLYVDKFIKKNEYVANSIL